MKHTIASKVEVDLKTLHVVANVRYTEDATINGIEDVDGSLIPFLSNGYWKPVIDIETGKIIDWPAGTLAEIHYKVCDECAWSLCDAQGEAILFEEGDYVPGTLSPGRNGYGDYIIMTVQPDGTIENWDFQIMDFVKEED
jgi:hypothetical protein